MIKTDQICVIDALKIGDEVEDILEKSDSRLRVHSIFEHAINLINDSDWIITLLPEGYPAGPQAVILTQENFARFKSLGLGAADTFDFNKLIGTKKSQIIYRRSGDKPVPEDIIKAESNNTYFESLLSQKGNKNGLLGKDNMYSRYAAPILTEFQTLFLEQRFDEAGEKLLGLIGLGPGLTPSGDDFVLGVFAAIYSFGMNKDIISSLKNIMAQKAKNKTNIISYNMLRQGAMGGFIEWAEDMADAVIYGDPQQIEAAFSRMLKIGSSSGSDISAGILFGITNILALLKQETETTESH